MSTIKVDTYLTRGGASEIAIDKLKGVSSAASISVVAEGGTNTTNLQQGLAKHWSQTDNFASIDDSFNLSSLADVGTGQSRLTVATNFSSENNSSSIGMNYTGANGVSGAEFDNAIAQSSGGVHTTSTIAISSKYTHSNGYLDVSGTGCIFSMVHGDLA